MDTYNLMVKEYEDLSEKYELLQGEHENPKVDFEVLKESQEVNSESSSTD